MGGGCGACCIAGQVQGVTDRVVDLSGAGPLPLDFDGRGMLVDVRDAAGETRLASVVRVSVQTASGTNGETSERLTHGLVNPGPDLDPGGTLRFRARPSGQRQFGPQLGSPAARAGKAIGPPQPLGPYGCFGSLMNRLAATVWQRRRV